MKIYQLEYFVTLCHFSNMSRASQALHISQPSLSSAIHELEEEFGVKLFNRRSKGLEITDAGMVLQDEANIILNQTKTLKKRMESLGKANQSIKLGITPLTSSLYLPEILTTATIEYPYLKLNTYENEAFEVIQQVSDGKLDAALVSSKESISQALNYIYLGEIQFCAFVNINNPLSQKESLQLQDLRNIPLVIPGSESHFSVELIQNFQKRGIQMNVLLQSNMLKAMQSIVEKNQAVAILYKDAIENSSCIAQLPLLDLNYVFSARFIWRADTPLSAGLNRLIKLIRQMYASH